MELFKPQLLLKFSGKQKHRHFISLMIKSQLELTLKYTVNFIITLLHNIIYNGRHGKQISRDQTSKGGLDLYDI